MTNALPTSPASCRAGMHRRRFLLTSLAGTLAAPLAAEAQQAGRVPRVALLSTAGDPAVLGAFAAEMRGLGYVEGRNLITEIRTAGRPERFPNLVSELIRLNIDVIVAWSMLAVLAAKQATTTIPIVMGSSGDAVAAGLVRSLSRPGGNITGLSTMGTELSQKYVELLREAVPTASRVFLLIDGTAPMDRAGLPNMQAAAKDRGVTVYPIDARSPDEIEQAFIKARREGADSMIGGVSGRHYTQRAHITALALKHRLPGIYWWPAFVEAGELISYGPDLRDLGRRAAHYVDKILKGAKPADLPIEQPTKFELVINLKTAKALGLTISPSLLARADQVVE
jgi:putative tryptophan/tyrosine transport system substrate-binding protein